MKHELAVLILRFGLGGALVSVFAVIGQAFKPKTFAGLFSAAPSVALASLAIAFAQHGAQDAACQGRSMVAGAVAMGVYSLAAGAVIVRPAVPVALSSVLLWSAWLATAALLWLLVLHGAAR